MGPPSRHRVVAPTSGPPDKEEEEHACIPPPGASDKKQAGATNVFCGDKDKSEVLPACYICPETVLLCDRAFVSMILALS